MQPDDRPSSENLAPNRSSSDATLSLLVVALEGAATCALPPAGVFAIGRGDDCDLRLEDHKASRKHVLLTVGSECTVVDLGSHNGTLLGPDRLAPHVPADLHVGEALTIGSTLVLLRRTPPREARLLSAAELEVSLSEERATAIETKAPYALIRVDLGSEPTPETIDSHVAKERFRMDVHEVARSLDALRQCLRPGDVLGSTGPGRFEALLPATTADEAGSVVALLRRVLRERHIAHALRLACFPRDAEAMHGSVRAALDLPVSETVDEVPLASVAATDFSERLTPMMRRIADGEINVLILGETGVGKEVLAHAIHARSSRRAKTMLCINCAAFSETLLESELFGHEKGAFTGAVQSKAGLLESASGSTVFLDEVGEMPPSLQAKLLRVLEQREVLRVGAVRPRPIDVRFLAATNRDLDGDSTSGRFRRDLYFRLNGVSVLVPPLRERPEDITQLARLFARQAAERAGRRDLPAIAPAVMELLLGHEWPGNVRELRNVVERAMLVTSGRVLTLDSFPAELVSHPVGAIHTSVRPAESPAAPPADRERLAKQKNDPVGSDRSGDPEEERERIVAALHACSGNQTRAALMLGMSRRTLVSRLNAYALPRPRKL